MAFPLRQSTASQEVPLGPFVDSADGDTAETALAIASTDIRLWKAGATTLAAKSSGGATHMAGGVYYAVLDATDTNTLGPLVIFVHVAGALAVRLECVVHPQQVYDSLYGADRLQVDTHEIEGGDATDALAAAVSGLSTLNAAGVRSAVGLAAANLDSQLGTIGSPLQAADYTAPPTAAQNASAVWAASARTLTSFGSLVSDIASAVWAAAQRTLTAFGFTPTPSNAADVTAIRERTDRLPDAPASRGDVTAVGTAVGGLNDLSQAQARSAAAAALTSYDPPTRAETVADKAEILSAITGATVPADPVTPADPDVPPLAPPATAYFTADELRAAHPDLANTAKYPDTKLESARVFAEQWFEAALHAAYVVRTTTSTVTGTGGTKVFLPHWVEVHPVIACKIDGVSLTDSELANLVTRAHGVVERAATWPKGSTIELTYTHGYRQPVELAKQAVMMLAAEHVKPSTIPARATSISTDLGNYRISQADKTGKTGIPDVDAIIGLLGEDKPVTG